MKAKRRIMRLIAAACAAAVLSMQGAAGAAQAETMGGILRLHIMANSDSAADQRAKLAVRDAVLEAMGGMRGCESEAEAERLCAQITQDAQSRARENSLRGEDVFFDTVSVGATINAMLAAVMAEGQTVLENVAKEPHIVDVANFLNMMGADVRGAGTDVIKIRGVKQMHG